MYKRPLHVEVHVSITFILIKQCVLRKSVVTKQMLFMLVEPAFVVYLIPTAEVC